MQSRAQMHLIYIVCLLLTDADQKKRKLDSSLVNTALVWKAGCDVFGGAYAKAWNKEDIYQSGQ